MQILLFALFASAFHERSIIAPNNLETIETVISSDVYPLALAVARMESGGAGFCSAFRIAEDLFMTNEHCAHFQPCNQTFFHLGYEPGISTTDQKNWSCSTLLVESKSLDFAIFSVSDAEAAVKYPIAPLLDRTLEANEAAVLASFAGTFSKSIDRSEQCKVVDPNPTHTEDRFTFTHSCDTMAGSSGSPVWMRVARAVGALHWGGIGEGGQYNQAIRMMDILNEIKSTSPKIYDRLAIIH